MSLEPEKTPERDELCDQFLDAALREVVGGKTPPDLSGVILERADADRSLEPARSKRPLSGSEVHSRRWGLSWRIFAIAATILFAASGSLILKVRTEPELARRAHVPAGNQRGIVLPQEERTSSSSGSKEQNFSSPESSLFIPLPAEPASGQLPQAVVGRLDKDGPASDDDGTFYAGVPYQFDGQPGRTAQGQNYVEAEPVATVSEPEGAGQSIANSPRAPVAVAPPEDRLNRRYADMTPAPAAGKPASGLNQHGLAVERFAKAADGPVPAKAASESLSLLVEPRVIAQSNDDDALGITAAATELTAAPASAGVPRPQSFGWYRGGEALPGQQGQGQFAANMHDGREGGAEVQHFFNDAYGIGPGLSGDQYQRIEENPFKAISTANTDNRLSTFSIDVDTASYANVRQFLMQSHTLPPPDAVRIEELVNYFDYDYTPPTGDVPFAAHVEVASCPWTPEHQLVRIGIKGREIERSKRPPSNLVFLVDVSGSMDQPKKLPLLVEGLRMLTRELGENDRVAIVVYASSEGLALESTRGTDQSKILAALDQLSAGGSTAGGAGIQLAYQVAADNFIKGGVNRVILCTDGDFNVGVTSPAELERMAEEKAKETGVFLTVLGFGRGNLNDAMMEQIADKGNGNYHYVDSRSEARKVLVREMSGTLATVAKDVKIQVEFNPAQVAGYRLIGYEHRVMAAEDFNDDKKDAGEIGAGHTVTALYEIVPAGEKVNAAGVDELKYAAPNTKPLDDNGADEDHEGSDELLTLKIRYKAPDGDDSTKLEFPVEDNNQKFAAASDDFKFASAVASFGMLLRDSQYKGNATLAAVAEIAGSASKGRDPHGYRAEFIELVNRAKELSGE